MKIPKELIKFYKDNKFVNHKNFGENHWWLNDVTHLPGFCWACHSTVDPMERVRYPELAEEYEVITGQKKN